MANKTYDQFCPIARGLDLLGERWTLLILRELSIDEQRFTDLRRALKGIAPNLLSDRLSQLQDEGLVEQAELPPPAARTVYRLTDEGLRVVPVIRAVGRFGGRYLPEDPDPEIPMRRTLIALLAPWTRRDALGGQDEFLLDVDGQRQLVRVGERRTDVQPAPPEQDDERPVLSTSAKAIAAARRTEQPLEASVHDRSAAERFAAAFALTLA
jgi:DNA-binding HxlR family transcriptional regulator